MSYERLINLFKLRAIKWLIQNSNPELPETEPMFLTTGFDQGSVVKWEPEVRTCFKIRGLIDSMAN